MSKKLSNQQIVFCQHVVNGIPAGRAYEKAGYRATGNSADAAASRLLRKDKVILLIESMRIESKSEAVKTAQEVKEGISRLLDSAESQEDYTGFVSLATRLAKMDGHDEPERMKMEFEVNIGGAIENTEG